MILICLSYPLVRGDTYTSHSATTVSLGSALVPRPVLQVSTSLPPGSDTSAIGQFSMELHVLEAAHALQSLSEVSETQLSTEELMHELSSVNSEVKFRKVIGSAEVPFIRS